MAIFYIKKWTKEQYPNIFREINKTKKTPVSFVYDLNYGMKPLGHFNSIEEAKEYASKYALKHLGSKKVEFKPY